MRHHAKRRAFGRRHGPRIALVRGLVYSLVEHGRIKTTLAKAKEARRHVEKAITLGQRKVRCTRAVCCCHVIRTRKSSAFWPTILRSALRNALADTLASSKSVRVLEIKPTPHILSSSTMSQRRASEEVKGDKGLKKRTRKKVAEGERHRKHASARFPTAPVVCVAICTRKFLIR